MYRRPHFILAAFAGLGLAGCGPGLVPVSGVIKLDGAPVEGATVTFVSEDGVKTFSGTTDSSGAFSLGSGNSARPGALPGNYKVTVVKTPKVQGAEAMSPGNPDYLKQMQKEQKEAAKSGMPKTPMPGMPMPRPVGMPGSGVRSELPTVYAALPTTPLSARVPSDTQPLVIELKSKP